MTNKEQFLAEYGEFLGLSTKSWDIPKFGITGANTGDLPKASVQVSLKGEIDMDSLYYVFNGFIYELDIAFLKPDLLDTNRYSVTGFEYIKKGKLEAIKVPFKYLNKIDIANMNHLKEEKLVKETMTDKAMDDLIFSWKPAETTIPKQETFLKYPMKTATEFIPVSKPLINRLLTKEDFVEAVTEHTELIKNSLLIKREKFSPDNWDTFFRKTAMRKQKSVLAVADGFLDKDLERYYSLLNMLSTNDNISDEYKDNLELQEEVEDTFNSLINWFLLQKLQMLKQVRAKL